ncbi:MAG: hypothetical protein DCF25_08370 [Leptolyngbya foveolarum]|uniref:Uncharacterized protein n=1 Tax=Leptolyngbya foveolarum TaxID=47253 RepID=A0A2W4WAT3_9CYAN|nr:MAG: hypothetical protein DCF25_08370 [Leptolyngbya foveolarum]
MKQGALESPPLTRLRRRKTNQTLLGIETSSIKRLSFNGFRRKTNQTLLGIETKRTIYDQSELKVAKLTKLF